MDTLIDQAAAVFLHQTRAKDRFAVCHEALARAPLGAARMAYADERATGWKQWDARVFSGRSELEGARTVQPNTLCVPPGLTVMDVLEGEPAKTGVYLPAVVTAAAPGARDGALALARRNGDGEQQKRIHAVFARLQRCGATQLAACAAPKAAEPPAGAGAGAAAPSGGAGQPPARAAGAAVPGSGAGQPPACAAGAAHAQKKRRARKRVTRVTVDTNVMD